MERSFLIRVSEKKYGEIQGYIIDPDFKKKLFFEDSLTLVIQIDSFLGGEAIAEFFPRDSDEYVHGEDKEGHGNDIGIVFWILLSAHRRFDWTGNVGIIGQGRWIPFSDALELVRILKEF